MTRDFGQAPRYNLWVIAAAVPQYLSLGIATVLTTGIWLAQPPPAGPSAPSLAMETPREPVAIRSQSTEPACEAATITAIVIRGQFTARERTDDGFAISFAGSEGRYTVMTDPRGYFEVRIPREDFEGDPCNLPLDSHDFSDTQMTLQYRIDIER